MKKLFLLFALLAVLPLVLASSNELGTYAQGSCINLIQTCSNCTYSNVSTIVSPNSSIMLAESVMTKQGTLFNRTFCGTNLTGTYLVTGNNDPNGVRNVWDYNFYITPNGERLKGDNFLIFAYLVSLIAVIASIVWIILNIVQLVTFSTTVMNLLSSWATYVILMFAWFLNQSYVPNSSLSSLLDMSLKVTAFTSLALPLIGLIVTMVYKSTQKKKPVSVVDLTGRMRYG